MAMFGTTQGVPATNVSRPERISSTPTGGTPSGSELTHPTATQVSKPNDQPIR